MDAIAPPKIFSPSRREKAFARALQRQHEPDAAAFLAEDAGEDLLERLAFLRHDPRRALLLGDRADVLKNALTASGAETVALASADFDLEQPWPESGFDFIAALFVFDTTNDLPGALLHMQRALAPGGLAIAVMVGAGSLPVLRDAMLAADGERPSPRLHPQVDVRAGGQLLQRAGFAKPVVDSRILPVRYGKLETLVDDLRAQGLANQLADPGPQIGRAAFASAQDAFAKHADNDGRVTEVFHLLTLSGWRS